jgi:membrane protein
VGEVVREVYRGWRDHRVTRLGAALAYYGLFALVPLVTIVVIVADLLLDFDVIVDFLAAPLADLAGQDVETMTRVITERVSGARPSPTLGLLGVTSLVLSASLLFVALQDALNVVWGVPVRPGLEHGFRRRLLAFVVVLGASGVVTISIAVETVVISLRTRVAGEYLGALSSANVASRVLSLAAGALALALLYRLLPLEVVDLRAAMVSGTLAAITMWLVVGLVGSVLERTASVSAQGAAGSVLVMLSGLYLLSQIALVGAELSRTLTQRWRPLGAVPDVRDG